MSNSGEVAHPDADFVESLEIIIIIGEDAGAASSSEEDGSATRDGGSVGTGSTCAGVGSGGAASPGLTC